MFVPLDANPWITVTLAMVGKFQIAASFAVIYIYAGELMPTVVRSQVTLLKAIREDEVLTNNNASSFAGNGYIFFRVRLWVTYLPLCQ